MGRVRKCFLSALQSRRCSLPINLCLSVGGIYAISSEPRDGKRIPSPESPRNAPNKMFFFGDATGWSDFFCFPLNLGRRVRYGSLESLLSRCEKEWREIKRNYNKSNRLSRCDNARKPYWQNILVAMPKTRKCLRNYHSMARKWVSHTLLTNFRHQARKFRSQSAVAT